MRIALAGLDSSRPVRVARELSASRELAVLVTDGFPVSDELRAVLAPDVCLVRDLTAALGLVDVVLDFAHAAARRRERVIPVLEAGVPVLVDKPLALTAEGARDLARTAQRHGVSLEADSGYRLAVGLDQRRRAGAASRIVISGPADAAAPEGGLAFYGSHHVQLLDELRPRALDVAPVVERSTSGIVARLSAVELRFVGDRTAGFTLDLDGRIEPIAPPPDYLERLIGGFLRRCRSGSSAVDIDRLVRPVASMERIMSATADLTALLPE